MSINIDFKNFLPASMRDTRWGEFMEAVQSLLSDIKDDKISRIVDQFHKDRMTSDDFENLADRLGWNLTITEGWASELEYLKRQLLTIVDRILYKTTPRAYQDEFWIFNLFGNTYPLLEDQDSLYYYPYELWNDDDENLDVVNILDSGDNNILYYSIYTMDGLFSLDSDLTLDQSYPVYGNPRESGLNDAFLDTFTTIKTLDQTSELEYIIRQFILQYTYKLVEDADNFLSSNSMFAFYNDIAQLKRKTEKVYFEPKLEINYVPTSGQVASTYYEDFNRNSNIGIQQTICCSDISLFDEMFEIQLGNGAHPVNEGSCFSGVASHVYTIGSGNIIREETNDTLYIRRKIYDNDQMVNFSEIALIYSGQPFLYSTFPSVNFHDKSYSSVAFDFINLNYVS